MNTTDPKQAEEKYVVEKGRRILMTRRPPVLFTTQLFGGGVDAKPTTL